MSIRYFLSMRRRHEKMSVNGDPTYIFKPFEFTLVETNQSGTVECPSVVTRVGSNNAYFFVYGFIAQPPVVVNGRGILPKLKLWKYCIDSGKWGIVSNKDVPQGLSSISSVLCCDNVVITFCRIRDHNGALSVYRMYLGYVADGRDGFRTKFEEFELCSDVFSVSYTSYAPSVLMDGKYVYSVDYKSNGPTDLEIQRLDLNSKKWEILVKKSGVCPELDHRYQLEVIFYKESIYVFGYERRNYETDKNTFIKLVKFDVAKKDWEVLPVTPDAWPLISVTSSHSCVQYPEKSNLVYVFGTTYGDVWRFDMNNHHWQMIKRELIQTEMAFQFIAVSPSGWLSCYCEPYSDNNGNDKYVMISGWLTIPNLKYISWEAMKHYFKQQMFADSIEHLKEIGIPEEFYERIIEMRRT